MGKMNAVERLERELRKRLPSAEVGIDRPEDERGVWWLDVGQGGLTVAIEWRPGGSFGISTLPTDSLGEGSDELYGSVDRTAARVQELLETGEKTRSPRDVLLQQLREDRDITQEDIARILRVSQASVSKMERRSDMRVSTLGRLIRALGGELEIRARFAGETVRIRQFEREGSEAP